MKSTLLDNNRVIKPLSEKLPKIAFLYLDYVLRFFDRSNFKGWPDKIDCVVYHWGNDQQRFIQQVKRKKIKVLIGNIPATAYESFRKIARVLPEVTFIPSLDSQFANKSKENVTRLCRKYKLSIPQTRIFYERSKANTFLETTSYPKIIKKSFGPSNYGGYYVHKVDSYQDALKLLNVKGYHPVYVQNFVPMAADIRVMLIGHKPVCAFWRRPPEGEWLTNTSQGGSMDYQKVPQAALDLSINSSKASNAEYWACDIAVGKDGQYRILECATAFAAFPYIRDWIGQYLMWKLSNGHFTQPHVPLYNWEEIGKIDPSLLRSMRHITFAHETTIPINDCAETFGQIDISGYPFKNRPVQILQQNNIAVVKDCPMSNTLPVEGEEWPSEIWNFQDNYRRVAAPLPPKVSGKIPLCATEEGTLETQNSFPELSEAHLMKFLKAVDGLSENLARRIVDQLGTAGVVEALQNSPQRLTSITNVGQIKLNKIEANWEIFRRSLESVRSNY